MRWIGELTKISFAITGIWGRTVSRHGYANWSLSQVLETVSLEPDADFQGNDVVTFSNNLCRMETRWLNLIIVLRLEIYASIYAFGSFHSAVNYSSLLKKGRQYKSRKIFWTHRTGWRHEMDLISSYCLFPEMKPPLQLIWCELKQTVIFGISGHYLENLWE